MLYYTVLLEMSTDALLQSLVTYSFSAHLHENALFYAERLFYESPTAQNLNLLAQCYFRLGKHKQAYLILHGAGKALNDVNRYLLSLACVELNKYEEAEAVLKPKSVEKVTFDSLLEVPGGAAGVYLLGRICRREQRRDMAIDYYKICLQVGSFANKRLLV